MVIDNRITIIFHLLPDTPLGIYHTFVQIIHTDGETRANAILRVEQLTNVVGSINIQLGRELDMSIINLLNNQLVFSPVPAEMIISNGSPLVFEGILGSTFSYNLLDSTPITIISEEDEIILEEYEIKCKVCCVKNNCRRKRC